VFQLNILFGQVTFGAEKTRDIVNWNKRH
jgi:hypothetical protein